VVELEDGLCRIEVLLDTVRATVLRDAIDQQAADWIRQAQCCSPTSSRLRISPVTSR
jgi:hypothetical protein